ncbi:protein translocase subunit secF [Geosporobacter subterraneus DSM 17957]|uniref:Protein-export membrane protein SecF n=1 Tax=Geosporobacter subterraneus DSM 17957 TaxID=1121919 RepID=A0A1M6BS91_9FIRM|nr:protein translocase subunit SecF [Geosporobacter subterraneus]SHI51551.1 protein translocase subunit secF [Geosporobacter subterraneus DSM 17957]
MMIMNKTKIWFGLSIAIIVIGLIMGMINGLNMGIDFTGGTMMQFNLGKEVKVNEIKDIISEFALDADIIHAGQDKQEVIIKTKADLNNDQRQEIFSAFKERYNLTDEDFLQAEQFGPAIGEEIRNRALLSIAIAALGMLAYITFRFEFKFGIAAIIALLHDIFVVLAVYAIFRIPVNSSFVAAILTIVGYSINDTIVVFDRIRENVKFMKKASYEEIADTSINQTIARSINTSFTTLLSIIMLYVLGVDAIRQFALPLIAGIATGTYSSIFIASPVWTLWKNWEKKNKRYNAA